MGFDWYAKGERRSYYVGENGASVGCATGERVTCAIKYTTEEGKEERKTAGPEDEGRTEHGSYSTPPPGPALWAVSCGAAAAGDPNAVASRTGRA